MALCFISAFARSRLFHRQTRFRSSLFAKEFVCEKETPAEMVHAKEVRDRASLGVGCYASVFDNPYLLRVLILFLVFGLVINDNRLGKR